MKMEKNLLILGLCFVTVFRISFRATLWGVKVADGFGSLTWK